MLCLVHIIKQRQHWKNTKCTKSGEFLKKTELYSQDSALIELSWWGLSFQNKKTNNHPVEDFTLSDQLHS